MANDKKMLDTKYYSITNGLGREIENVKKFVFPKLEYYDNNSLTELARLSEWQKDAYDNDYINTRFNKLSSEFEKKLRVN